METPFDIKAQEQANPRPKDLDEDQPWNPLSPRKEVRDAYHAVGYPYELTVHDRAASEFYAQVNGRPEKVTQEVTQVYRRRIPGLGEFMLANITLRGEDWKGNRHDFAHFIGRYDMPIFKKEKDPQTEKITTSQIQDHKSVYDIPWSKQEFDKLIEAAAEPLSLVVYGSAGRRFGISSVEDFRDGTLDDLIQVGTTGKSLESVKAERNQFTYEKREQSKQQDKSSK